MYTYYRVDKFSKDDCSGCSACSIICPNGAIQMIPNKLGFKYPVVTENLCNNCGACTNKCPFVRAINYHKPNNEPIVYAARSKRMEILKKSQSGGLAFLLSEFILNCRGVVYGVIIDHQFKVVHTRVANFKALERTRGSKYVQSDLEGMFGQIQNDLNNGKLVLFIGTPCQVAGLKASLHKVETSSIFFVDLICHGVGSPSVWKGYLDYIQNKHKGSLEDVQFRDKQFGWSTARESYCINGLQYHSRSFLDLYLKTLIHRESCFHCPFTNTHRVGDVSLGDFWGWDKINKTFNDDKGLSLVFINNKKGEQLLNGIIDKIDYEKSDVEHCLQPQLQHPVDKPALWNHFAEDFMRRGFRYCGVKYGDLGFNNKTRRFLWIIKNKIMFYGKSWYNHFS